MKEMNENYEESKSLVIEGRNAVLEALRSGKPMDKLDARTVRSVQSCVRRRSMM